MDLLIGTIHRRLNGVEFKIKSEKLEELFKLISGGAVHTPVPQRNSLTPPPARTSRAVSWGNVQHYQIEMGENGIPRDLPGFTLGRFDMWGSPELLLTRNPPVNLSMLTAVGLGDGVTIVIPTVISPVSLKTYIEKFESAIRQLYIDFLKESVDTIKITTEVVTRSIDNG